jgi:hypothetical protein
MEINHMINPLKRILNMNMSITNFVFMCHAKVTTVGCLFAAFLLCSKQFVGAPIVCHSSSDVPNSVLESFCWNESTYVDDMFKELYQFIWISLIVQAGLSYMPFHLWSHWESGNIKSLAEGMTKTLLDRDVKDAKVQHLVQYFMAYPPVTKKYSLKFTFCEVLNLMTVLTNILLMNRILG